MTYCAATNTVYLCNLVSTRIFLVYAFNQETLCDGGEGEDGFFGKNVGVS